MSRVFNNQKHVNIPKHNPDEMNCSKITRTKGKNCDYTKATSLSSWLFLKYDMSYKQFQKKSKNRKDELRNEYLSDTTHTCN